MPQLIKKIEANLCDNFTGNTTFLNSIYSELQQEDYIGLSKFSGYIQNLSRAENTEALQNPLDFGLKNDKNLEVVELNIDY